MFKSEMLDEYSELCRYHRTLEAEGSIPFSSTEKQADSGYTEYCVPGSVPGNRKSPSSSSAKDTGFSSLVHGFKSRRGRLNRGGAVQ